MNNKLQQRYDRDICGEVIYTSYRRLILLLFEVKYLTFGSMGWLSVVQNYKTHTTTEHASQPTDPIKGQDFYWVFSALPLSPSKNLTFGSFGLSGFYSTGVMGRQAEFFLRHQRQLSRRRPITRRGA